MSRRRTCGMLLRGGSIFGLLCLNEKGTIITKGSSCLQGVLFFSYFPFISISSVSGASSLTLAHCLERRVLVLCSFVLQGEVDKTEHLQSVFWGHLLLPKTQPGYESATFAHSHSAKHPTFQSDATHWLKQLSFHML